MKTKLNFERLFAYSDKKKKYFYSEFDKGVNIIYGKNTSGKSTVLKSILYTLGINDSKSHLIDVLNENVVFRLDCTLYKNDSSKSITFIREDETLIIKQQGHPVMKFNGISGDSSAEHIKLKKFYHELLGFSMRLESKSGITDAPIETIFLPYYISQSVGWVYLRKSFSNLDFYKNFKEDYLDYYLGIENSNDKTKKYELESKLSEIKREITFYSKMESSDVELQVTKISDEKFTKKSLDYINSYKDIQGELLRNEKDYISKCNEISYYSERKHVLSKVKRHQEEQEPEKGKCPACYQTLPNSLSLMYQYYQDGNDTFTEMLSLKDKIKTAQSSANSLYKKIESAKTKITKDYEVLNDYSEGNVTYHSWLKNKANTELIKNIDIKLGRLTKDEHSTKELLKGFKTDDQLEGERNSKSNSFKTMFIKNLNDLGVKKFEEERYTDLYRVSAFPYQGVELHKTLFAYHFAFNKIITKTEGMHRAPFILDAIFKEDIEADNKKLLIDFISKNMPLDTQTFMSIAVSKSETETVIKHYNRDFFGGKANLICIGGAVKERSFLTEFKEGNQHKSYLNETLEILNNV